MADPAGPEHYSRAEDLLKETTDRAKERTEGERSRILAEAQVHATLALVSATVYDGNTSHEDIERWDKKGAWLR